MKRVEAYPGGQKLLFLVILAPRERQILTLLARGADNKQISRRLDVSLYTVRKHVARLITGLMVRNRIELLIWTIQHPRGLAGDEVSTGLHPPMCGCDSAYCVMLRAGGSESAA
jgi:DNA-binding CsgD family transcriptional regulator